MASYGLRIREITCAWVVARARLGSSACVVNLEGNHSARIVLEKLC